MADLPPNVLAAMDTPWEMDVPGLEPGAQVGIVRSEPIEVAVNLKPYSLRNGQPEEIEPYLLTAAIPAMFHWVSLNGLTPRNAMKCMDGLIKSYLYRLTGSAPPGTNPATLRKQAIILGACRAVMTTNFELMRDDINAQELAAPVLSVAIAANGTVGYTSLIPRNAANAQLLTADLGLTEAEVEVIKVLVRCAQAIIPIQGLNLITDGHHYLSERSKQSYKAFLAVEKQVWVPNVFKEWINGIEETVRDTMWHKAGHPVAVPIKEAAATDLRIKENLVNAKLGSAAARLPALESDLRAADTYVKLVEAVDAVWGTVGGAAYCDVLRLRVGMVKSLSRDPADFREELDMGSGLKVRNRAAAVKALKETVDMYTDKAAVLYGFYCSMLESTGGEMGGGAVDTLRSAYSLKKLRSNNIAAWLVGTELYKDFRSIKQAARRSSNRTMPIYDLDGVRGEEAEAE